MPNKNLADLKFPTALLYALEINDNDKDTIKNFCEDFDIKCVEPRLLVLPIAVITELNDHEPREVQNFMTGPAIAYNFGLFIEEIEGRSCLMVEYESTAIDLMYDRIEETYETIDHEDMESSFILSCDIDSVDLDLEQLSFEFNRYMPSLSVNNDVSGFYSEDELNAVLLGTFEDKE